MVISVFSKPKLHKILPPLVWDKEMIKPTTHTRTETDTHTQTVRSRSADICCLKLQEKGMVSKNRAVVSYRAVMTRVSALRPKHKHTPVLFSSVVPRWKELA